MKRIVALLVLICGMATATLAQDDQAQEQQKLQVTGQVIDFLTQKPVDSLFVEIIQNGRSIDTARIQKWGWGQRRDIRFTFDVTKVGHYEIRIVSPGFKTKYVAFDLDKFHKSEKFRTLPVTYMQKEKQMDEVNLDEVTVTATRLKFYTNGDTLVYDATAFQMADGSMLDALIKRLPGVTMEDGGVIYVNGKKVDELQLNGRELLDSDKELFLENLPAYMIKNIGVHEQTPRQYVGTPMEDQVEKEMVMNVKMKREYAKGWIFNLEGGIGASMYDTDEFDPDKYLARLFASKFSDVSRLTLFANVNNLNDYRDPGEQGNWTPLSQSTGLMETYKLGVTGSRFSTGDIKRYNGNGNVTYSESTTNTWGNGQQDYNGAASTYSRSYNLRKSYDTRLQTQHRFNYNQRTEPVLNTFKNVYADANIRASYHNYHNNSTDAAATLDADVREKWGKDWLDSLLSPQNGDLLKMHAVNRTITRQHGEGHDESVSASMQAHASPQYNDRLQMNVNAGYDFSNQNTPDYNHYLLEYPNPENQKGVDQKLNRYNDNFTRTNTVRLGAGINYALDDDMKHNISFNHSYNYNNRESNRSRYLLHMLDNWDIEDKELGLLPSMTELAQALDANNSSYSHSITNSHTPTLGYNFRVRAEKGGFSMFNVQMAVPINGEEIDYKKGGIDTVLSRTTTFAQPSVSFMRNNWTRGQSLNVSYNMTFGTPDLTQMVDLVDNSNPLNITHGNPDLKNSRSHNVNVRYRDKFAEKYQFNSQFTFSTTENAVAMGYIYDPVTAVRTSTPQNINGNWNVRATSGISIPLDKDQRNMIRTNVNYRFTHSVDLNSTSNVPQISEVGTHNTEGSFNYDNKLNSKFQFGLNATINYRNSQSDRANFQTQKVYDYRYGASLQAELFGGLQVSSDLTMYSRRGYSGNDMNSNELIWNARVSKSVLKGKVTIMLDAFDLLHNLSNIRYNINAQGHTETYSNVIPSYALLHVVWRFTKNKGDKGNKGGNGASNNPGMDMPPAGGFGPGNGGGRSGGNGGFGGGQRPAGGMPPMR